MLMERALTAAVPASAEPQEPTGQTNTGRRAS
jgi:hypothetical protein